MINNPVHKQLPTLENPGTAIDLRSGKSLIAPDGSVVTGTVPEVEQATPSISVSSGGLITATAAQVGGIVADGTKSATQQLTTQGAETITPGTTAKTAVAEGLYTTGDIKVAGDANLVAENIAEGISIFGVTGAHSGAKIAYGTYLVRNNPSSYAIECDFEPNYGVLSFMDTLTVYNFEYKTGLFAMYCKNGVWTSYGFAGSGSSQLAQKCGRVDDPVSVSYLNGVLTFNLGRIDSINGEMVYLFVQK